MTANETSPLEVLACDWQARPVGAPAIGKIAQLAQGVDRLGDALVVTFDTSAASDVQRFAAAERSCCATLTWDVRTNDDGVALTIHGSPEQLDLLQKLFTH